MTVPKQGDVWFYQYLWHWQHDEGSEHGRKPRPTALVATVVGKDDRTNLFILPITSKRPSNERIALEVPQIERRRAGLDSEMDLWVTVDEDNHDVLEASFYFDPNGQIGAFSPVFNKKALELFVSTARQGRAKKIPRTD